ncbi:unnamed protein product [Staurois parvus]|uniref:Uncharacterized protein n=1 Tax=Staurois parvus TaxID=386267 RepID=A0ABN9HQL1_9NEOB|nr:unnamed protein product [Staurois parvus]
MGPLCPQPQPKKPMKKVPGASHGSPTDPGPSGKMQDNSVNKPKHHHRLCQHRGGLTTHGAPGQ